MGYANFRDYVDQWYNLKACLSLVLSLLEHCLLQLLLKQNGCYDRIVNFIGQLALFRNKQISEYNISDYQYFLQREICHDNL